MTHREERTYRVVTRHSKEPVTKEDGGYYEGTNALALMRGFASLLGSPAHAVKKAYMVIRVWPEDEEQ